MEEEITYGGGRASDAERLSNADSLPPLISPPRVKGAKGAKGKAAADKKKEEGYLTSQEVDMMVRPPSSSLTRFLACQRERERECVCVSVCLSVCLSVCVRVYVDR